MKEFIRGFTDVVGDIKDIFVISPYNIGALVAGALFTAFIGLIIITGCVLILL